MSVQNQVQTFLTTAKQHGFKVVVKSPTCICIEKSFTPGDIEEYVAADMSASHVLALAPLKGGSVWGTDSGSVGGHAGLYGGYYRLNKTGDTGVRFITALRKVLT